MTTVSQCSRCGESVTPGAHFCSRCGFDVSGVQGNVATAQMTAVRGPVDGGLDALRQATIGEYEILAELGRGGMATVYLGHEISLDRKVAIKVMAPGLMHGEGMAERFRREARTAASLSHPHIIPIYAVKEAGRILYFVMKFISGRPLDDIIREIGPLPISMVQAIFNQVGSALGYAHRRGIVHRDIKPANVMIDDEGWAVVTDFGIAKVAETQGLTMTGVAVGTPSYMSPEQCAAKEVTGQSDQYSLGVVAYEMLTGKQPFTGDSAMAIMWAHFNDPPRPILQDRPDCPPDLAEAVERMLAKGPPDRWPSMDDAVGAVGGKPLAHDDPIRLKMVELARTSRHRQLLESFKTPTSPVPPGRSTARAATVAMEPVASVTVSPRSGSVVAGDTVQLAATAKDGKGKPMPGRVITWGSSEPAVATVSSSGVVTAVAVGTVTVTATCEGHAGTAEITVAPVPVASVTIAPASASLEVGESLTLTATPRDDHGQPLADRPVRWASETPSVAKVSGNGAVEAVAPGQARITATSEGKAGAAALTVVEVPVAAVAVTPATASVVIGEATALRAVCRDARGQELAGRPIEWSSRNAEIATVSASGEVSGVGLGTVEIVAVCEGQRAAASVTVTLVPVAAVVIAPARLTLEAGEEGALSVTLKDAKGRALPGRSVTWRSSAPGVAQVTPEGAVTARSAGSATIMAVCEGIEGKSELTVQEPAVASVRVAPSPLELELDETVALQAEALDKRGKPIAGKAFKWATSKSSIAAVSGEGEVRGVAAGQATITVTCDGKKATTGVTVVAPTPARAPAPPAAVGPEDVTRKMSAAEIGAATGAVTAEPSPAPAPARRTRPRVTGVAVAAEPKRSKAPVLIGVGLVGILAIAAAVVFTRGKGGEASSVADTGAFFTPAIQATPVVSSEAVAAVVPPRMPASVPAGETIQLRAAVQDAAGTPLAGREISWSSSNQRVATVTPAGVLTTVGEGTTTITVSSEGKSEDVELTVAAAAVANVAVSPTQSSLAPGNTMRLSAEARDAKGVALKERAVEWSTSDPKVATVSGTGVVSAVGTGTATISATSEGKSGTATVTVQTTRVDVASVTVTGGGDALEVGGTVRLTATLKDARGGAITDRTPAWSSSDERVARVAPDGTVHAMGPGTARITATGDEKSNGVTITVNRIAVASVALNAPPSALTVGQEFQLAATARDARNNILTDRAATWTSSNARVATVSPSGRVSATGAGSARITASVDGTTAAVDVSVTEPRPAVAAMTVSPGSLSLQPGERGNLTGTARDGRGTPIPDAAVSWSSSNPAVATVGAGGQVTAVGAGTATITATSERRTASANVTVAAAARPVDSQPVVAGGGGGGGGGAANVPRMSLAAGGDLTCGLTTGGVVACWGGGQTTPNLFPASVRFTTIAGGESHACGLTSGGNAYCWGSNAKGQLGTGARGNAQALPVMVSLGEALTTITVGAAHACGLNGEGRAWCWGSNSDGQLGDGSTSDRAKPVQIPTWKFSAIAAGGKHTCGILQGGRTLCWGDGWSGQLGYGPLAQERNPVEVAGEHKFESIAAGGEHTCALTEEGKAWCWGGNRNGQVGDGSTSDRPRPVAVAGSATFRSLSLGEGHSCGLAGGGAVYCWGSNAQGQVGDGSKSSRSAPVRVSGSFVSVTAGARHTCGATTGQGILCWGDNRKGQLGDGGTTGQSSPVEVKP